MFSIQPARPEDVGVLRELIIGLARFEQLEHLAILTDSDLEHALFGDHRAAEAVLLRPQGQDRPVAFALFFHNFSTFLGRRGLYLEDLFVEPDQRGRGYGKALLIYLARLAVERGCGRFEWCVLDWNVGAQKFYEGLGASLMPEWRLTRIAGNGIATLASVEMNGG